MAHDKNNEWNIGDRVRIQVKISTSRPLSKRKTFVVTEIIRREQIFQAFAPGSQTTAAAAAEANNSQKLQRRELNNSFSRLLPCFNLRLCSVDFEEATRAGSFKCLGFICSVIAKC